MIKPNMAPSVAIAMIRCRRGREVASTVVSCSALLLGNAGEVDGNALLRVGGKSSEKRVFALDTHPWSDPQKNLLAGLAKPSDRLFVGERPFVRNEHTFFVEHNCGGSLIDDRRLHLPGSGSRID